MTSAAAARIGERVRSIDSSLKIVEIASPSSAIRDGESISTDAVQPEIGWLTQDAFGAGLAPAFFKAMLDSAQGRWIQSFAAGIDFPLFEAALEKRLRLTRSDAQAPCIAEHVLAHVLNLRLPILAQAELQSRHEWRVTPWRELSEDHWLIIGFGAIGQAIAKRARAFDAHVTAVRRSSAPNIEEVRICSPDRLPSLLPEVDVVVLAAALNDQTRKIANTAFFDCLKAGTMLVNIGRGELIDEPALRLGLMKGRPAHAVLDVFEMEPLPADHWAWDHPQVRVTAHTSHAGSGTALRNDELFLENLKRYLAGEELMLEVKARAESDHSG